MPIGYAPGSKNHCIERIGSHKKLHWPVQPGTLSTPSFASVVALSRHALILPRGAGNSTPLSVHALVIAPDSDEMQPMPRP